MSVNYDSKLLLTQNCRGHGRLSQGDAAVIGRSLPVIQDFETGLRQPLQTPGKEAGILPDATGKGHQVQPQIFTLVNTDKLTGPRQGFVEPGRHPVRRCSL